MRVVRSVLPQKATAMAWGLSQWGAKALAEQGQNFADILAHYYPGTSLSG